MGLVLSGAYILVAAAYIVFSTLMVASATENGAGMVRAELTKGLGFVLVTGILLFLLSRHFLNLIAKQSQEIARQKQSIEALDRRAQVGLLASAIGHDANNLLGAVSMSLELLKRGVDPDRQAKIIASLSGVLNELIILNDRLVRGGEADQPGERQLRNVHHESQRVMQFLEAGHPVGNLRMEFTSEGDVQALINRHLYFQVMLNLLSNCARHAGDTARVRVHTEDCGDRVCVTVEDDGPGVPEDLRETIFEPYFTNHPEGAGVGLASVRSIMRMHDGEIRCTGSEALGGAKFLLYFPRHSNNGDQDNGNSGQTAPLREPQLVN